MNNVRAQKENGEILFDPSITCKDTLADCFRIFTDDQPLHSEPADRLTFVAHGLNLEQEHVTIYTDGACFNNGKANAYCGAGVWISDGHPHNRAIRVPGEHHSNQVGELVAIIEALRLTENFKPLTIKSDSNYSIKGLTKYLATWEDNGWIGVKNSLFFRIAAALLRARTATTKFHWVKAHRGELGNEAADIKAKTGARKPHADELNMTIHPSFLLKGAKIATISQSTAYKGIRERTPTKERRTTNIHLARAQAAVEEFTGQCETTEAMWKATTHPDLSKKIQQFLYKCMHNCYRVGDYWANIEGYEDRTHCKSCNHPTEDLDHILTDTECSNKAAKTIWTLARSVWPYNDHSWPDINLGIIMACGALTVTHKDLQHPNATDPQNTMADTPHAGATRLLRILIAESAYLIWVIRCERVIQQRTHTLKEITTRWLTTINRRLMIDRVTSCTLRRTNQYKKKLVATWGPALHAPPDDWPTNLEVLVGIEPPWLPT
ncbi:RnaseH-domain-containing protein [Dentipellis sp. KUC8613]|nr:RnaseH-domain-containing protein [Dentipellis sp. KUC8613]